MEKIESLKDLKNMLKENLPFIVLLVSVISLSYANLVNGQFLNLDDNTGIVYNQELRDFNGTLRTYTLGPIYAATIIKLFGLNATAFHVGSIILHIINSILVFILAYIILGKKEAIVTSLLFSLHPVNTETVGWISSRGYLINSVFIISSLITFSSYKKYAKEKMLYISIGIFALNLFLMRDPWSLITPFIIIALDQFVFSGKFEIKRVKTYIPYIVLSLLFSLAVVLPELQGRVETLETKHYLDIENSTPILNRIPYTIAMASKLLIAPITLSIYHEGKIITGLEYAFMIIISALVIGIILKNLKGNNRKIAGFGMIIFLSVLPSFSPILIAWSIAERYLYIASAFFSMILATITFKLEEKTKKKNLSIIVFSVITIFYSTRTIVRTNDLKNSKNLWLATQKTAPYSYRVYNNLGDVYASEKNYDLAIENFKKSVALKPGYADAVHNIGYSYLQKGDDEKAKQYLLESYKMNPLLYQAAYKLGIIDLNNEDYESAKKYFEECLQISHGNADCTYALQVAGQKLEN